MKDEIQGAEWRLRFLFPGKLRNGSWTDDAPFPTRGELEEVT
jgi:hypothetical protein